MKQLSEIKMEGEMKQLSLRHRTITGYDKDKLLIQVDTKHCSIVKTPLKYPPINVKSLRLQGKWHHFIVTLDQITIEDQTPLMKSNLKAQFTGAVDCYIDQILYAKYHNIHHKHSISIQKGEDKRVLKLFQHRVNQCIFDRATTHVLYSNQLGVHLFDIGKVEEEVNLKIGKKILSDGNHTYLVKSFEENFKCSIYDSRVESSKYISWSSKGDPLQIQMYGNNILFALRNQFIVLDIRKIFWPFLTEPIHKISSFYYQPNLNKLYVSCMDKLKLYSF